MKKYVLIASLFFVLTTLCNAQTNVYHPFPDSNAAWGMSSGCTDVNCGDYAYIKYYYGGDTIIDGINYKKIVREVLPLTNGNCCIVPEGLGAGFLRQDTVAKKVYWRDQWIDADTLLYDFTLNVGDTLNSFLNDPWDPKTIKSIDSVLVGTSYRKRFNIDTNSFEPQFNYSIIEGVGSTDGFSGMHIYAFQFGIYLTCFSENGNIVYTPQNNLSDTIPCGDLPVAVNDLYYQTNEIVSLFPNPALDGSVTFRFENMEHFTDMELKCFDVFGKEIHSVRVYQFQGESKIGVKNWKAGIYFAIVYSNGVPVGKSKFVLR